MEVLKKTVYTCYREKVCRSIWQISVILKSWLQYLGIIFSIDISIGVGIAKKLYLSDKIFQKIYKILCLINPSILSCTYSYLTSA